MTKTKRNYTPRVPATVCPHCLTRSIAYDSHKLDVLTRELRYICQDPDCGCTFVAQLAIYRTVRPSMKPNPIISAMLPEGEWRSKPANDDQRVPANDDQPDAAEVVPSPT